jgi:hypothetical protein
VDRRRARIGRPRFIACAGLSVRMRSCGILRSERAVDVDLDDLGGWICSRARIFILRFDASRSSSAEGHLSEWR